jgi:hypothetical protein
VAWCGILECSTTLHYHRRPASYHRVHAPSAGSKPRSLLLRTETTWNSRRGGESGLSCQFCDLADTVPLTITPEGNSLVSTTSKDFVGYETDYYEVRPREGAGIGIAFSGAEAVEQGKTAKKERPILDPFSSFAGFGLVRMVYLDRESKADHDALLVAAGDEETINRSAAVVANNAEACRHPRSPLAPWFPQEWRSSQTVGLRSRKWREEKKPLQTLIGLPIGLALAWPWLRMASRVKVPPA